MVKLGSGNYVKTADVSNGDMITFKSQGDWIENTRYQYPDGNNKVDFVIKVEIKGEEKSMRMNATNRKVIIAAYGEETQDWVGKTARITKVNALVGGKMQDCIILQVPGHEGPVGDELPF